MTTLTINQEEDRFKFPTVTVIPKNAADLHKVEEFMNRSNIDVTTTDVKDLLSYIPNLSYGLHKLQKVILSDDLADIMKQFPSSDVRSLAFGLSLSCESVFKTCIFKLKIVDCCQVFLPVFTEHGFGFAFNSQTYGTAREE